MSQSTFCLPKHISIIGGGRWARVIAKVLYDISAGVVEISIHTRNNYSNMHNWVLENNLGHLLTVSSEWPVFNTNLTNALIVVNAAKDHDEAIQWGLSSGIPVLVEKPMSLSSRSAKRLALFAKKNAVPFESSNVFLFATYFESFINIVNKQRCIKNIHFYWKDPKSERRYGEAKKFDPSLSLFADCLPHVLPMLHQLVGGRIPNEIEDYKVFRGGAKINLEFSLNGIPCFVYLERGSDKRNRLIEVNSDKSIELNFTTEPGIIKVNSVIINNNCNWEKENWPIARMLRGFFKKIDNGIYDRRFDINYGLNVCELTEKIYEQYLPTQRMWLKDTLKTIDRIEEYEDVKYCINELFQSKTDTYNKEIIEILLSKIN
jgi:hypothetical protein